MTYCDSHCRNPRLKNRNAIVRYLDMMRSYAVSRFIRNRRRLIELLNEQNQAIINRAVTRGLDPNVPLKPSGIDWLGEIPDHWEMFHSRGSVHLMCMDKRSTTRLEAIFR